MDFLQKKLKNFYHRSVTVHIHMCYYVLRRLEVAFFHDRPPLPLLPPVRWSVRRNLSSKSSKLVLLQKWKYRNEHGHLNLLGDQIGSVWGWSHSIRLLTYSYFDLKSSKIRRFKLLKPIAPSGDPKPSSEHNCFGIFWEWILWTRYPHVHLKGIRVVFVASGEDLRTPVNKSKF